MASQTVNEPIPLENIHPRAQSSAQSPPSTPITEQQDAPVSEGSAESSDDQPGEVSQASPACEQPQHPDSGAVLNDLSKWKWISITGSVKTDIIGLASLVVAVYIGLRALSFAQWEAVHDFREGCESDQVCMT